MSVAAVAGFWFWWTAIALSTIGIASLLTRADGFRIPKDTALPKRFWVPAITTGFLPILSLPYVDKLPFFQIGGPPSYPTLGATEITFGWLVASMTLATMLSILSFWIHALAAKGGKRKLPDGWTYALRSAQRQTDWDGVAVQAKRSVRFPRAAWCFKKKILVPDQEEVSNHEVFREQARVLEVHRIAMLQRARLDWASRPIARDVTGVLVGGLRFFHPFVWILDFYFHVAEVYERDRRVIALGTPKGALLEALVWQRGRQWSLAGMALEMRLLALSNWDGKAGVEAAEHVPAPSRKMSRKAKWGLSFSLLLVLLGAVGFVQYQSAVHTTGCYFPVATAAAGLSVCRPNPVGLNCSAAASEAANRNEAKKTLSAELSWMAAISGASYADEDVTWDIGRLHPNGEAAFDVNATLQLKTEMRETIALFDRAEYPTTESWQKSAESLNLPNVYWGSPRPPNTIEHWKADVLHGIWVKQDE